MKKVKKYKTKLRIKTKNGVCFVKQLALIMFKEFYQLHFY
jgi:hypothetical protein